MDKSTGERIREVYIIQQVPHESAGIFKGTLRKYGIQAHVLLPYKGDPVPDSIGPDSAVMVLGGPMGAMDDTLYPYLKDELRLIEFALKKGIPIIGVCLGAQLMARAAGARVYSGDTKEIGWYDISLTQAGLRDPLLLGSSTELSVFQWHGDTFDLPPGATRLASSKLFPNQLIKIGKNAYAMQFHLEVTEMMIRDWLDINKEELDGLTGLISSNDIEDRVEEKITALNRFGDAVFSRFLRM